MTIKDALGGLIVIGIVAIIGGYLFHTRNEPNLAETINKGVETCLETVGFWPCSVRHQNIVKEHICGTDKTVNKGGENDE